MFLRPSQISSLCRLWVIHFIRNTTKLNGFKIGEEEPGHHQNFWLSDFITTFSRQIFGDLPNIILKVVSS